MSGRGKGGNQLGKRTVVVEAAEAQKRVCTEKESVTEAEEYSKEELEEIEKLRETYGNHSPSYESSDEECECGRIFCICNN